MIVFALDKRIVDKATKQFLEAWPTICDRLAKPFFKTAPATNLDESAEVDREKPKAVA